MKGKNGWNVYVCGVLSGLLSIASILFVDRWLGVSTVFVRSTGMIETVFSPDSVTSMPYFIKEVPIIDWQMMFVLGTAAGACMAALLYDDFTIQWIPDRWAARFGRSIRKRAAAAFFGGIIAMFGARLADGCSGGYGLSGGLPLEVSGYIALICFFYRRIDYGAHSI